MKRHLDLGSVTLEPVGHLQSLGTPMTLGIHSEDHAWHAEFRSQFTYIGLFQKFCAGLVQ